MKRLLILPLIFNNLTLSCKTLTVSQAISTAKKHRPNLQALEYKVREEKLKIKEAWAGYLPQLQLVSTAEFNDASQTAIKNYPQGNFSTGLQAQQLLYRFGGPQQQARIATAALEMAKQDKATQEAAIAYDVTKTFIDAWLLQKQKPLYLQLKKSSRLSLNKAKQEFAVATTDQHDYLGAVESNAITEEQVFHFAEEEKILNAQLHFLMGLGDQPDTIETLAFTPPEAKDFDKLPSLITLKSTAQQLRPEVQLANQKITLERETKTLEKYGAAPSINLVSNVFHNSVQPYNKKSQFNAGISLQWPIFDGTRSHIRQQEAEARVTASILQKEQLLQEINFQVEQAYHLCAKAATTYCTQEISCEKAKIFFKKRSREYNVGLITNTLLEEAKSNLMQTKNRKLLAAADYAQKQALLLYRCGKIN